MAQVQARKEIIVKGDPRYRFEKNKIDGSRQPVAHGKGKVDVTTVRRRAAATRKIIVATGSQPEASPAIAIDRKRIITSE